MMLQTGTSHLSPVIRNDQRRITALVLDGFAELITGKRATRDRFGHIVKLILHGDHAASDGPATMPGTTMRLMAIVNHPNSPVDLSAAETVLRQRHPESIGSYLETLLADADDVGFDLERAVCAIRPATRIIA